MVTWRWYVITEFRGTADALHFNPCGTKIEWTHNTHGGGYTGLQNHHTILLAICRFNNTLDHIIAHLTKTITTKTKFVDLKFWIWDVIKHKGLSKKMIRSDPHIFALAKYPDCCVTLNLCHIISFWTTIIRNIRIFIIREIYCDSSTYALLIWRIPKQS